jgi:tetraacyldisaccharide 4'-kinase
VFLKVIRVLLFPISVIYDLITRLRNHLFDSGYKPSFQFDVLTISVGNLNVGGSGKTPMVEYLIRLLLPEFKIATLSRGYRRGTRGFRLASESDNAATLGDEPFQLFRKFGSSIKVAVGEERALAIPNILHECPEVNCILLDDAYQHRTVRPHTSILLTEFDRPFHRDHLMPTGNLREARSGAKRADLVVVTKCPGDLRDEQIDAYQAAIRKYISNKPVFFSQITYDSPIAFGVEKTISKSVVLVSGIAHADLLKEHLLKRYDIVKHFHFPDHHVYSEKEASEIVNISRQHQASILTTEKDMVRLIHPSVEPLFASSPLFYIPIRFEFLRNGADFDRLVLQMAKSALK